MNRDLDSSNEFIRITDSRLLMVQHTSTVDIPDAPGTGLLIGARREIVVVMLYRPDWMERNYIEPMKFIGNIFASQVVIST